LDFFFLGLKKSINIMIKLYIPEIINANKANKAIIKKKGSSKFKSP